MHRSAESLHVAAVDLVNRGRLVAAERMLVRAAARSDEPRLSALIIGTLAMTRARRGAIAEAEQLCREALATPGLDGVATALLAGQLGSIAEQAGRWDEAERWLDVAIDGIDDPVKRAHLLMNRSVIGMQRGLLESAARDVRTAAETYSANALDVDAAEARHNLGYIDLLRGDLVSGLHEMESARPVLARSSSSAAAVSDLDRAQVLRDAGLTREAEELLAKAAIVFGSSRMPKARAEAELNLARSLLMHDPARARRAAGLAARRFRALGITSWEARAQALGLRAQLSGGSALPSGGRAPHSRSLPSIDMVNEIAETLERYRLHTESAALRLTWQLAAARRLVPAAESGGAIRLPVSSPIELRLLSSEVRAARAAARRRHVDVRRHAAGGLDALARWQSAFGSLDLQTSIVVHGNGLMSLGLASAVRSGRPDVVFDWSERARHLSLQVVPLRPPPDPALAEELAELRMLRAESVDWHADPRAVRLRELARERQWSGTRSAHIVERATLDEVQAALDSETSLLSFVFSGDQLSVLVVSKDSADFIALPEWPALRRVLPGLRADLDMAASIRDGSLAGVVRGSLNERLVALSGALLSAPLSTTSARRLIVTSPGVLNGIPWAMLPELQGRVFTLATSATQWVRGRGAGKTGYSAGFAVGPRVRRGSDEVQLASSAWLARTSLKDDEATVRAVTDLASRVDVLHIAAHGRHAVENPLFSGLELADGSLFGYDVDLIPSVPQTVILSACEAGRSSVRWGEEAIGMARIWLHAGTRCVIAAPVIVADDDACELLGAMHEGLAAGEAPAVALAAASARTGIVAPFQAHGAGF